MLETLRNVGINIDEELTYYRDLSNDDWTDMDYFEALTRAVFGGIRNGIIEDKWSAISEAFSNFDIYAVAKYDQAKIQELMQNDKIIRNRVKIEATIENAEKMVQIVRRFGSFKNYINFFSSIEDLIDALQGSNGGFIGIGETNVYEFLKEIAVQTIKPDRQVTKIFFRLGVIGEKVSLKEIAETGNQMAKEVNERPCTVDWVLWRFGSEVCRTKNANCEKCSLALVCAYRKGLTTKS
jgi:endonuclease III